MTADFQVDTDEKSGHLRLTGTLDLYHASAAKKTLQKALSKNKAATLDASGLTKLDTVGAMLLKQVQEQHGARLENLKSDYAELFKLVSKSDLSPPPKKRKAPAWRRALSGLGKKAIDAKNAALEMIAFFGRSCVTIVKATRSAKHMRVADIMHHIEETGIYAIPIIGTMSFMIAVVIAYQAVAQLRPLGAQYLTVNLVSISVLREMGVLLTAIMVAGRSGSAFTAEIGVMKSQEEVDALKTIGIDPFEVLVMPRILALLITLPLLTFMADFLGLLGGGVMCKFLIDIPLAQYFDRVRSVVSGHDFEVGLIKAPVFAFLIAITGCMHGMKVSGSAESVGLETTASVVKSIFLVMVADALFSILFQKMGI